MTTALAPLPTASSADGFLARYEGLTQRLPGDGAPREAAADILRARGLPTLRDEAWRYTSLAKLGEVSFHEALTEAAGFVADTALPDLDGLRDLPRLVFVQGRFNAIESVLPQGAIVRSFAASADFGLLARPEHDRMVALNTMLAEDGAIIEVPANVDAGALLLISVGHDIHGTAVAFHPRHAVRLAEGAALTVVELACGQGQYLHNPVTEIVLGAGARLTHVRLQNEGPSAFHLATIYADLAADAAYESFTLSIGARVARTEVQARLSGPGAHAAINAAQLLRGTQHSDFTTIVSHDAPSCASRQTVKHVLAGHARGVFQGKIEVARAAQKTDGYQMNQALLLSPDAEIDCKPQLEIFADDVKCSHGATVGELDPEQIFYLVSRGIPQADARAMLVRAFLAEALDMVQHEAARAMLERVIDAWWSEPA
jgi:Fe-S cluster assembly protein SufD